MRLDHSCVPQPTKATPRVTAYGNERRYDVGHQERMAMAMAMAANTHDDEASVRSSFRKSTPGYECEKTKGRPLDEYIDDDDDDDDDNQVAGRVVQEEQRCGDETMALRMRKHLLSHSTRLDTNLTRATTRYEDTNKRRRANVWHGALPLYFECGVQGQNQATSATTPRELELLVVCNSEHEAYIESTHAEQLMYVLRARFTNAFSCSSRACVEKLERMPHATRRDATVKTNANANDEREPQTKRRRFRGGAHSAAYS
ncbi:hypothetical protein V9T40_004616 [Parthenolecanium corni]|uniref:Uncharacterized protein n=1 Tax=Parthenolecanium corni TaxID=536013 RepID=A0AAN9Y3F4_9HEMI